MKKQIYREIEIPEGIEINLDGNEVTVQGKEGKIIKRMHLGKSEIEKKDGKIIIGGDKITKKEKKLINTTVAHIKNAILGVKEKFEYKLKICFLHFPINVKLEKDILIIKNFLGEKKERKASILKNVEVIIDKEIITIKSTNKETAGQTAANIEKATRIKSRDKRIFQDGIYIINKAGKEI